MNTRPKTEAHMGGRERKHTLSVATAILMRRSMTMVNRKSSTVRAVMTYAMIAQTLRSPAVGSAVVPAGSSAARYCSRSRAWYMGIDRGVSVAPHKSVAEARHKSFIQDVC